MTSTLRTRAWRDRNPEAARAYSTDWTRQKRAERQSALATWKLESGCVDCGYDASPLALEFDHVMPILHGRVSELVLRPLEILFEEIDRCVVRCANCHSIRTLS